MKGVEVPTLSSLVLWIEELEIEPRVASMCCPGAEALELEAPDMIRPSASVVVKFHCLAASADAVLGLIDGPLIYRCWVSC